MSSTRPPAPLTQSRSTQALRAVSGLMEAALGAPDAAAVRRRLVTEARSLFDAQAVALLSLAAGGERVRVDCAEPARRGGDLPLAAHEPLAAMLARAHPHLLLTGEQAAALGRGVGWPTTAGLVLLLPIRNREEVTHVLALGAADLADRDWLEAAEAFAAAAGAALAQFGASAEQTRRTAEQAALVRAARSLNAGGLDLSTVLHAICREIRAIFGADSGGCYRGNAHGLLIEAIDGLPQTTVGARIGPGEGVAGKVAVSGRPLFSNAYQEETKAVDGNVFSMVRTALAAPMRWDGELRGVLSVGFHSERVITPDDVELLEAFAELAAAACRNANQAAGLAQAARTDGLTGCLNRGALEEAMQREIGRARRTGRTLSLILVDLDDFKQVNERAGHLVGDEVLRRVGHALRSATRPYDVVARYGGDEFAVLAPDADGPHAISLAGRVLDRIETALSDLGELEGTVATAGVAEWRTQDGPSDLVVQADRALLFGKQDGGRGRCVEVAEVPVEFGPRTRALPATTAPRPRPSTDWRAADHAVLHRRTRQLHTASALSARLAPLADTVAICEAVVDELSRGMGYERCCLMADDGTLPSDAGPLGQAARDRRTVLAAEDARAEIAVPVWATGRLWGVLDVSDSSAAAFDQEDQQLLQAVADVAGGALAAAELRTRLQLAREGTAAALTAALGVKDPYTAAHARSIVEWVVAVGRRLGLCGQDLEDLRLGAVFHDVGKIGVPESILAKPGPLTPDEREIIEQHTVAGEQILAPVEHMRSVLPIVRHEHERYDGGGYPDGLAGERIPIGARIVFVCDAYHAMTSDRPYRAAMPTSEARAELVAGAGTQFDPDVVDVFLAVLAEDEPSRDAVVA